MAEYQEPFNSREIKNMLCRLSDEWDSLSPFMQESMMDCMSIHFRYCESFKGRLTQEFVEIIVRQNGEMFADHDFTMGVVRRLFY